MPGPLLPIAGLTAAATKVLGTLVRQSPKASKAVLDKVKKGTASKSEKEAVKAYRSMSAQEMNRAQGLTLKPGKAPRTVKKQTGGKVATKKPQSGHNRLY
jgi:hypothetical protein